jgi:hypothetical protein
MVSPNQMPLKIFDTQLGMQGMEGIDELRHCLAPLLMQRSPSHVLVIIVNNMVIVLLDRIQKKNPKWARPHIFQNPM